MSDPEFRLRPGKTDDISGRATQSTAGQPGAVQFAAWFVLLLAQVAVWHWRLRTLSLIWSLPSLNNLRDKPDAPWGVFRWFKSRLRRRAAVSPALLPT